MLNFTNYVGSDVYTLKDNGDFNQSIVEMNINGQELTKKHAVFQPRNSYFSIIFKGIYSVTSAVESGVMTSETTEPKKVVDI